MKLETTSKLVILQKFANLSGGFRKACFLQCVSTPLYKVLCAVSDIRPVLEFELPFRVVCIGPPVSVRVGLFPGRSDSFQLS